MKKYLFRFVVIQLLISGLFGSEKDNLTVISSEQKKTEAVVIQDVSAIIEPIARKYHIPAMAGLVVRGDVIVMEGITGVRKKGTNIKATLDDLWHLGSCTKSMTATLCAILVQKEILKWDLTLEDVFPDVAKKMHKEYRKVTLSNLLTNRGGFPGDLLQMRDLWDELRHFKGSPKEARRCLLERIVIRKPETIPGTKYVYSNAGFAVAGHIAETITGKEYEELMQEYIFAPLNMKTTGWGAPGTWENSGTVDLDEPWGHKEDGSPVKPLKNTADGKGSDNPVAIAPAGRLHCTIKDWAKYVSIHLRGSELNPNKECRLLSSETFEKLQTPPDKLSDYAYGWICCEGNWAGPVDEKKVFTHAGSNTMWYSVTWVAPKRDFAVLVCCNLGGSLAQKGTDEAVLAMIEKTNDASNPQSATNPQQNP
jgi:CubicO group peptidase (beta-lactamase class C family)